MDKNKVKEPWPSDRRCPECGKKFGNWSMEDWVYRDRGQYVCSYKCQRAREKRREEEAQKAAEKRTRGKLTPAQKEKLIRQLVYRGMSNEEISRSTGISPQLANYYRKKIEEDYEG